MVGESVRGKDFIQGSGLLFLSLLLCSCAAENPAHPRLPPTVAMNQDAGRGGVLIVQFQLADGEKLPLVVDTGAPGTVLDKSLEPKLGNRLDTGTLWNFGVKQEVGAYAEPKFYLGNIPLQTTGTNVVTFDRQKLADQGWPTCMGFIGMDVLHNYCIQLDFAAGKLRFLDDEHPGNWGEPFPLKDIGDGCLAIDENLAGVKGRASIIDTGCNSSGWLQPDLLQQWTKHEPAANGKIHSPDGTLGGEIYHDLDLRVLDTNRPAGDDSHIHLNGIGLRALAENVVTFDFPKRMMYLKHTSDWPLVNRDTQAEMKSAAKSSIKPLKRLLGRDQLPGISKNEHGEATSFHFTHTTSPYLDTGTWDITKKGDSSAYHYVFTRVTNDGPWKLQKAWRTNQDGQEEQFICPQ